MDQDIEAKRKKKEEAGREARLTSSKFFCPTSPSPQPDKQDRGCEDLYIAAGPSRLAYDGQDKENVPYPEVDDILMEEPDVVMQEDGYISPSPSMARWDTPELSSPIRPRAGANLNSNEGDEEFGADFLSSPPVMKPLAGLHTRVMSSGRKFSASNGVGRAIIPDTPSLAEQGQQAIEQQENLGPDLRDTFDEWDWDEVTSDIECPDASQLSACSTSPSPWPVTPDDSAEYDGGQITICDEESVDADELEEIMGSQAIATRNAKVANGWWEKWARGGTKPPGNNWKQTPLKRRETTMTPGGRQRPLQPRPHSAQPSSKRKGLQQDLRSAGRRSLVFTDSVKTTPKNGLLHDTSCARPGSAGSERVDDVAAAHKNRLAAFRWTAQ